MAVNFDTLTRLFGRLGGEGYNLFQVGAELLLIGLLVNWCAGVLHGTRGMRLIRGVLILLVAATLIVRVLADQFGWTRFELLYRYFIIGMALISLLAFQPELRRALIRAGEMRFRRRTTPHGRLVSALVESASYLSRNRYGALIAIQRDVGLANWAENGTILNAEISANLINSLFYPNSALHDLGVIVRGNQVWAAGCQFPVAESGEVDASLGSRHRAAVGLSSESDALVLVVSEETGTISLADRGKLTRYLALDDLDEELNTRLSGHVFTQAGARRAGPLHDAWRFARRLLVVAPLTLVIWFLADQASLMRAENLPAVVSILHDRGAFEVRPSESAPFELVVSGPTREVVALSALTGEGPLQLKWSLPPAYARPGRVRLEGEELRTVLEELPILRDRGVFIDKIQPGEFEFDVHEIVSLTTPIRISAGGLEIQTERIEPEQAQVWLRQNDLAALSDDQRVIDINMTEALAGVPRNRSLDFIGQALPTRLGTVNALRVEPATANLRLRVIAKRKSLELEKIPVRVEVGPQTWQNYELIVADAGEWLISLTIEGDEVRIDSLALRPQDVRAVLTISREQIQASEEFRVAEVTVTLPEGVTLVSPAPTVRFRLEPKEGTRP